MNTATLEPETLACHRWYEANRDAVVARYNGRHIAIAGCAIVGDYASQAEALRETLKIRAPGTFIVKKCLPKSEEPAISFHSRVAFP